MQLKIIRDLNVPKSYWNEDIWFRTWFKDGAYFC